MDNPELRKIRESAWRKTPGSQDDPRLERLLSNQPEAREDLAIERRLTECLRLLPDAPASTNFTARAIQQALRAPAPHRGWRAWRLLLPRWAPRLAAGALMLCLTLVSVQQYRTIQQAKAARQLADLGQLAALPEGEWLDNFATIDRMGHVDVADDELLASLR